MADLEQQQPPVVPADNAQYNTSATAGAPVGGTPGNRVAWLKTPRGALRLVEWLFAIISFACMADVNGFDHFSAFQFLVAVGVLIFLYTLTLMIVYTFRNEIETKCLYLPVIELAFDGIFCVLLLAAGAAAAQKANEKYDTGFNKVSLKDLTTSRQWSNINAAIVFTFFNLLCMIASTFFSYKENAAEENKPR